MIDSISSSYGKFSEQNLNVALLFVNRLSLLVFLLIQLFHIITAYVIKLLRFIRSNPRFDASN